MTASRANHQSGWNHRNFKPTPEQIDRERAGLAKLGIGIDANGVLYRLDDVPDDGYVTPLEARGPDDPRDAR